MSMINRYQNVRAHRCIVPFALVLLAAAGSASAQILQKGMAVATCFSGASGGGYSPGFAALKNLTDPALGIKDGPVLAVFDIRVKTLAPTTPWRTGPHQPARSLSTSRRAGTVKTG